MKAQEDSHVNNSKPSEKKLLSKKLNCFGSGGVIVSQAFLFTKTKEVMPVMNKLTMTKELGNARELSTIVDNKIRDRAVKCKDTCYELGNMETSSLLCRLWFLPSSS